VTVALAGVLAGVVHVLSGPDHLAAIAPYAVTDKARSWWNGVRWGVGHSAGVLAVGLLVLLARRALPVEALAAQSEIGVGLALLAIGAWGLWRALRRHGHAAYRHDNRHGYGHAHGHAHVAFAVGTLHGLAGSSHLLGIVPALALPSDAAAGAYLLCFGAGSVAAMGTFASCVAWIVGRPIASGPGTQRALLGLSSVVAAGLGGFWIVSSLRLTPWL
jgi:hypothetical protein